MQTFARTLLVGTLVLSVTVPVAHARPLRKTRTAPAQVITRENTGSAMDRKLRLESGVYVPSTTSIGAREAARNREKFILRATQAVEGGYDSVNIYDRGVLSWGLMQWTSHSGQLQDVLWYTKQRLLDRGQANVWASLFKSQGLDIQQSGGIPTFHVFGPAGWRPITGIEELRILFRGTRTVDKYDAPTVTRWSRIFARAGRHPSVQAAQNDWAVRLLRRCLNEPVEGGRRVSDYTRGDVFSEALTFALWTNNPGASRRHFALAVRQARQVTGETNPARWPGGLFPLLWEQTAANSEFGAWPWRTKTVARVITVGEVGRRNASQQLASRGWRMDALRRGDARGKIWIPRPATPPRAARSPLPSVRPESLPVSLRFVPAKFTP